MTLSPATRKLHFEVTVWNQTNGDIEAKLWDASEEELDALRERFEDQPWCEVVIDREWESGR